MTGASAATPSQYLDALIADSEDANLRFYLPTVLHFFREDLLRVITVGDSAPNGWANLEWHVDGRCSACDWPGPVRLGDAYYREFLTNGIPRERIYEIWSNVTTIKRGSVTVPRNTVIQEFGNALEKQCRALNSVVERLRTDFKGQLKANAPKLTLSILAVTRLLVERVQLHDHGLDIVWREDGWLGLGPDIGGHPLVEEQIEETLA